MAMEIIKVASIIIVVLINMVVFNQILVGYMEVNEVQDEGQIVHRQSQDERQMMRRSSLNYFPTNTTITTAAPLNTQNQIPSNCLSLNLDETMDRILSKSRPIFITMPAKASGSSLKEFTNNCMKQTFEDNFINNYDKIREFLTSSLELPSVITSHSYRDNSLTSIIDQSSTNALIIYIHRDETDRVKSGIEHYLRERACKVHTTLQHNATHCIMDEAHVIEIIKTRNHEIGTGAYKILTCDTFQAIEESAPNIIFMHYTQANKLQKLLAKNFCPDLMNEPPVEKNVAKDKSLVMVVRLKDQKLVGLDKWLDAKIDFLEWALQLKHDVGCQAPLRQIQDALFACPDQTFKPSLSDIRDYMG